MFIHRYSNYYTKKIQFVEFGIGHSAYCLHELHLLLQTRDLEVNSIGIDID